MHLIKVTIFLVKGDNLHSRFWTIKMASLHSHNDYLFLWVMKWLKRQPMQSNSTSCSIHQTEINTNTKKRHQLIGKPRGQLFPSKWPSESFHIQSEHKVEDKEKADGQWLLGNHLGTVGRLINYWDGWWWTGVKRGTVALGSSVEVIRSAWRPYLMS